MKCAILIAKDKKSHFFNDDYKVGWFIIENNEWIWTVLGSFVGLEKAIEGAKTTIANKNEKFDIYLSNEPLYNKLSIQNDILSLEKLN